MKLNVGDYVRTKNGLIFKIIGGNVDNWDLDISFGMLETFEDNWLELYRYNDNGSFFDNKNIVKTSPNIIDLLRKNEDYVNGKLLDEGEYEFYKTYPVYIKSVVTKEQFEQIEYKVED